MRRCFVIAEAGSCHAGYWSNLTALINTAVRSHVDAIKFQFCSNYERLRERRRLETNTYDFSIKKNWIEPIYDLCQLFKIEFMCTVYLPEDIEIIASYVKRFKIASFEAGDAEFLDMHRQHGKPLLISTGLTDENTSMRIYDQCLDSDVWMHCVSSYPCPDNQANLQCIKYGDGLSDHTKHPLAGAMAFTLGAFYVETHFRLDDTSPDCPDYAVAKTPAELKQYIDNIRQAEILLGDGVKKIQECEKPYLKYRVNGRTTDRPGTPQAT